MIHLLEGVAVTVGSAAVLAVTGGLIRLALIVRDTSQASAILAREVGRLEEVQLDHERRIARSEGFQDGAAQHRR